MDPPALTATRHRLIAAAATTLVLAAGGCGSGSGSSSDATSSSGSDATSSSGSAAASETSASSSGAAGTHSVVVDGTPLTADAWRVKCQKNDAETTGTADLLEDVPLEETADAMFVSVDFDIADGKVSDVKNVSVTGGPSGDVHAITDETTVTISETSVRAEGTARGTVDGAQRDDIPFTVEIACPSWGGLTDEGDQIPPG